MQIVVVGGGAAGFFGAIQIAQHVPQAKVVILEKSPKILSKVKISGGGRCNVTHHASGLHALVSGYPRGHTRLKPLFSVVNHRHVMDWFETHGVPLKTEPDGRVFPLSDSSQSVIDCFLRQCKKHTIDIRTHCGAAQITKKETDFVIKTTQNTFVSAQKVLVACGGFSRLESYEWLKNIGHSIVPPIPSLFTFNAKSKKLSGLMGVSVPDAIIKIEGTHWVQQGSVLITHWGLSGPAVLKLSAWAARHIHDQKYQFVVLISWIGKVNEMHVRKHFHEMHICEGRKLVIKNPLYGVPQRLWTLLCTEAMIQPQQTWADLPAKNANKLAELLLRYRMEISGKTTFKDEFVTCGGIPLEEINIQTMESKKTPGVFFAGEVLDVDGITGGYNFQAAWSSAWVAAKGIGLQCAEDR